MKTVQLHVITTGRQEAKQVAEIAGAVHPYIDAIHIREKTKTAAEIYNMVKLFIARNVPLSKIIINDRIDVAYALNAAGVHLAHHSLPVEIVKEQFTSLRVGCSVHSVEEACSAEKHGADYILFGHVFSTQSKPDLAAKGVDQVKAVLEAVTIPVIAIGGISPANAKEVIASGAQGIAVMSGIFEAEDPLEAAKEYQSALSELDRKGVF